MNYFHEIINEFVLNSIHSSPNRIEINIDLSRNYACIADNGVDYFTACNRKLLFTFYPKFLVYPANTDSSIVKSLLSGNEPDNVRTNINITIISKHENLISKAVIIHKENENNTEISNSSFFMNNKVCDSDNISTSVSISVNTTETFTNFLLSIVKSIGHHALSNYFISFVLFDSSTCSYLLKTTSSNSLFQVFSQLHGSIANTVNPISDLNDSRNSCNIKGLLSKFETPYHNNSMQLIFVNNVLSNSYFKNIIFFLNKQFSNFSSFVINNIDENSLKKHAKSFPIFIFLIYLPVIDGSALDLNLDFDYLYRTFKVILYEYIVLFYPNLLNNLYLKYISYPRTQNIPSSSHSSSFVFKSAMQTPKKSPVKPPLDFSVDIDLDEKTISNFFNTPDLSRFFHSNYRSIETNASEKLQLTRDMLKDFIVIGQFDRKFILCYYEGFILCIDQHAADERIHLEKYLNSFLGTTNIYDEMIIPKIEIKKMHKIEYLSVHDLHLLSFNTEKIKKWGWHFSIDYHNSSILLTSIPYVYNNAFTLADLFEFINGNYSLPPCLLRILQNIACKSSITFNSFLDFKDGQIIIDKLAQTDLPFFCAHGRPTILNLYKFRKNEQNSYKSSISSDFMNSLSTINK